jgi:hypothetical protein
MFRHAWDVLCHGKRPPRSQKSGVPRDGNQPGGRRFRDAIEKCLLEFGSPEADGSEGFASSEIDCEAQRGVIPEFEP